MLDKQTKVEMRLATLNDIERIALLEEQVWGKHAATAENIEARIETYAEGNPICLVDDKIVGYGTGMILPHHPQYGDTWDSLTQNGSTRNHDPTGTVFYGVSATATSHPGEDIFPKLLEHGLTLARQAGCQEFALGSRMPGYGKWLKRNPGGDAAAYLALQDTRGRSMDPLVNMYQQAGLEIQNLLPDYFPCEDSHDYGVWMSVRI